MIAMLDQALSWRLTARDVLDRVRRHFGKSAIEPTA